MLRRTCKPGRCTCSAGGHQQRALPSCSSSGGWTDEEASQSLETDDVALIARDMAIFSAFFDMSVYPVLDIQDSARIGAEAVEFRHGTS